jgi:hypothetical protein
MPSLTVPAPELVFDPPGGPPELEKPVTVRLPAIRYPDAIEVPKDDVRVLGALLYRGTVGSEEVWDEEHQSWTIAPADEAALAGLKPLPLSPPDVPGRPWQGTLIAIGQKDGAGNPRFAKAVGGSPVYRLRGLANVVRDGVPHRGIGAPSPDLLFVSGTEQQRFAVSFDTDQASDAGRARLLLKNGALQQAGYLEIRAVGGQEIEIANCDPSGGVLARVTLSADGDIHLIPAPGRQIVLAARLEAQQIAYQPQAGGVRQTL